MGGLFRESIVEREKMKGLKILTSCVAGSLALSLVAVTGMASATALYGGSEALSAGSKVESTGSGIVFKAGYATIQCSHSELEGATSNAGGSSQTVDLPINSWIVTGCNAAWKTLKGGKWIFHWTSGSDGTVASEGWEWTISYSGTSCTYGTPTATNLGTLSGGGPATLFVSAALTRVAGGFLCANPASLTATYRITNPVPLHITAS